MAKSIRSKLKRKFRAIKRQQVFEPVERARLEKLAAQQARLVNVDGQEEMATDITTETQPIEAMIENDETKTKSIGPKTSRRALRKKSLLKKRRKTSVGW